MGLIRCTFMIFSYNIIILCIMTVMWLVKLHGVGLLVSGECDQIVYNLGMRCIMRSDIFVHENV